MRLLFPFYLKGRGLPLTSQFPFALFPSVPFQRWMALVFVLFGFLREENLNGQARGQVQLLTLNCVGVFYSFF